MALATFLHLLRPQSIEEHRAQQRYRVEAEEFASRLKHVFDEWLTLREYASDNFELANAAAVSRWEVMRMVKQTERLSPPRSLTTLHRDIQNALVGAARACQLLANGYRFHKSEAVCDGQALLVETVADLSELVAQLQVRA